MLRFVLGVQVVEVAEELVEAVYGRQELVAVAEMVLAELCGSITLRLEQLGNRPGLLQMTRREGHRSLGSLSQGTVLWRRAQQYLPKKTILRWNYSSAIALGSAS
jgi:hypothetical protein